MRSPGNASAKAVIIDYDGSIRYDGIGVNDDYNAVRPALWITLEP